MTSSGSTMRARAISSSLRCPPDSEPAKSSFFSNSLKRRSRSAARSVLRFSWARHSGANIAWNRLSPDCPVAPIRMFSITVSRESTLVSWKVRTMPSRATRYAGMPLRLRPLNDQEPSSGLSKPVSRLKNVVFPAPFGPISAVITPRWISTCSTSTAVRPPKRRTMPSATTRGSGLAAPGWCSTPWSAARASTDWSVRGGLTTVGSPAWIKSGSAGIESQLPSISEDPLWSEDHQQHQGQAHEDETHQARLVGRHDPLGDDRVRIRWWPR